MLIHLQIRDFAIIEGLELEPAAGMSALTGETGAGKSIIVDALGLLLGDRADSTVIRPGAERADISALFELSRLPQVRAWLSERDLAGADSQCHLRRVIARNGRSRTYINGSPQPLQVLKELGERLVDIHGQHAHQSLLRREVQRQWLDDHAGNQALLLELAEHYQACSQLRRRLDALRLAREEREARLDLLRYQARELEGLNLKEGEPAELEAEHRRLANAGRLLEAGQRALSALYEGEETSVQSLLSQALQEVETLGELDRRLEPVNELLAAALIQVQEASDELRRYLQQLDLDPSRLAWVEQRLAAIQQLARKHRLPAEALPELLERLNGERDALEHSEAHQEQLQQELEAGLQNYRRCARQLSERRGAAAEQLAAQVSAVMAELGMPGGRLAVALERQSKLSPHGLESVEFLVSANPGQPPRPLSRVASGGELSRISLAIQVIAAHSGHIPTLIFDEVDSGIGGGIAEVVGRRLRTLGATRQVLCVTHLPQVAAQAHQHLKVSKVSDAVSTRAGVALLSRSERIQEIARMLGGVELTESTLAHAREMVERAAAG